MRLVKLIGLALMMGALVATPALADDDDERDDEGRWRHGCRNVRGKSVEIVAHPSLSPNDPLGRVVSHTTGTLNSIGTVILTSLFPSGGGLGATTAHLYVMNERDQLTAEGVAQISFIPGSANVNDVVTLNVTGGTGKFASATGQIVATGVGFNFLPGPTAGSTYFVFRLSGRVCLGN